MEVDISYTAIKAVVDAKGLNAQYVDTTYRYLLAAIDGAFILRSTVEKDSGADQTDFEANRKPYWNKPIQSFVNGIPTVRATAKAGWHFEPRFISYFTSTYLSLHNVKNDGWSTTDGRDIGDAILKFYDSSGTELTKGDLETALEFQARLDLDCTCTIMDFWPTYDLDFKNNRTLVLGVPGIDRPAYLYAIVAPDIPAPTGSVPMTNGGLDLRFAPERQAMTFEGAGARFAAYDPVNKSNKLRMKVVHGTGQVIGLMFVFEHFRA